MSTLAVRPKRPRKPGHTFLNAVRHACVCTHCADQYVINMPVSLGVLTAILKAYSKEHRRCRPTPQGKALGEELDREYAAAGGTGGITFTMAPPEPKTLGDRLVGNLVMQKLGEAIAADPVLSGVMTLEPNPPTPAPSGDTTEKEDSDG